MRIEVRGVGFAITDATRAHAHRKLLFALAQQSSRMDRIVVRIVVVSDAEFECRIIGTPRHGSPLVVTETDRDLNAAITRAARRIGHTVSCSYARFRLAG